MILMTNTKSIEVMLATCFVYCGVNAHRYLQTPRSRNYHSSIDPIWWGG